ncbi:unnamed protein product [Rotaria magnacalcarata]|uniref:Cystatin domain-containing protein n=3 Tax=Rotaria magnacalcarata TaxID=392030 RepID=A0A816HAZ6_9BILA|nr:unnamed protein product [Rotaria magnacalcarata]CAF1685309.1 unnamed protein product [Rotaria magnacalcarata]CAF2155293.1 unnamed protein product [Rotaria magnacalcarata]CAF5161153.1 unnamed protein product [Rotaria magnacalcarata]
MQTKTILALFCTIVILLIGHNDGAPTVEKTKVADKETPAATPKKPKFTGARTHWKTNIDAKTAKLFNDHKVTVSKKLNAVHKVPRSFNPKPAKYSTQIVNGILYHFLVQIPNNKYAYVTIVSRTWKKPNAPADENVTVREQLYGLNDKNI